jgi:PAS domain S-box-containing protein
MKSVTYDEKSAGSEERRLRDILDALPAAIYTTDANGRITYFNQAAVEFSGRQPEVGTDQWCITWKLYRLDGTRLPHDQCPMAVSLREQRPVRGEEAIAERPDGSRIRFAPYPTPLFDQNGRLVGAVNMLVDTTDQHKSEIESAHLAAIVSSSDDAIVSKTLDGIIQSWNDGAARIFGYQADEMIGEPITKIIPPELHGEEKGILARLRQGQRIDHYETIRVTKDGRRVDISLTVSPIFDRSGNIIGASKVGRDISERKHAEELQRLLTSELNHRVKNTLAAVQSMANQTMRLSRDPADFVAKLGGRIKALAHTHELLTENAWHGADVLSVIRDQLLLGVTEDERILASGPSATLDPETTLHLALVLHELGTNARKYGALSVPKGRLTVRWAIQTDDADRKLVLHWQESGGPPVKAPSRRGFGSTLIERSLSAQGGAAQVSYRAKGLSCDITLPLQDSPARGEIRGASSPRNPLPRAWGPATDIELEGMRILVVEDEPLIAMDVSDTLVEMGCVVVGPAACLEKAKELIDTAKFDIALLDANLGGHPVDELAAALSRRNIPFAFMTGYSREGLPEAFRNSPMLSKPFGRQDALHVIGQLKPAGGTVLALRPKSL